MSRFTISVAVAALLIMMQVAPAIAQTLPFSQSVGFSPSTATVSKGDKTAPTAGRGGLELSTAVTAPPGAPLGDGSVPPNIWEAVAWGCLATSPGPPLPANCANNGVVGIQTSSAHNPFANDRSALTVEGQFGILDTITWQNVTVLQHNNHEISGSILNTVNILSFLRLGTLGAIIDTPAPSTVSIDFKETSNEANAANCNVQPQTGTNAPVNPLGSACDDFAIVSSLDLASVPIPAGSLGGGEPAQDLIVDFRLDPSGSPGTLVCAGHGTQPALCGAYSGPNILIYTAEHSLNSLAVQARLRPADVGPPLPLFVIGDVEPHAIGDIVNFWGAQWWKNNPMSGFVSNGVASFKGFANTANDFCGGRWQSRPGNSSGPPETIPDRVAVIVTDTVTKQGPIIGGTIVQIVIVEHDGNYGPAPGHRGSGPVVEVVCSLGPQPVQLPVQLPAPSPLDAFVTGFYDEILGRQPSAAELAAWTGFLQANPTPAGASGFVHTFLDGPEYLATPVTAEGFVATLYRAFLGREPDAPGLASWAGALLDGYDTVLPGFVGSAEFRSLLPSTQDRPAVNAVVTRLYENVLGRAPAASEVRAWSDFIVATGDVLGMARGFFRSAEYNAAPRTLATHVGILYRTFLGRDPAPVETGPWVDLLQGFRVGIENSFIASPEFGLRYRSLFP